MEIQVPEYIRTLVPYVPGKPIEETQREFKIKRVIKLASNENPLGPSPKALRSIQATLKGLHRYPDSGAFRLKQALAQHLKTAPTSLILGNGSNEVIDFLIRTYCVPGDFIATSQAGFVAYKICAQIHGVKTLEVPIDSSLKFSPQALLDLVKKNDRVKVVFVANPNNPTGTYTTTSEMEQLVKGLSSIRGGSVILALDYAYWEYVNAPDLPRPEEILKAYPNTLVLRTFSKIYGLAGLRLGYGVASPSMISHLEKVRQPFNINSLALIGAEAALEDQAFVRKSKTINDRGMRFWEKFLTQENIPFWKSQGNFILADVKKGLGQSGVDVYQACLKQGVIFRPVANYGLHDALRISIGTPEENDWAARALVPKKKMVRKKK